MGRLPDLRDESGMTLIEMLVAITAGLFVITAITTAMLMTIRETGRVTSHVEGNQRARLAMTDIVNQLHSACVAPQVAPVLEKSSGTELRFIHQVGSAVSLTPVKSVISLSGTTLTQKNYDVASGEAPNWIFKETPTSTEELMKGVAAVSASVPIFRYYAYTGGAVSETPLATPLTDPAADTAVRVAIAFETTAEPPVSGDTNAPTEIQNSVVLRLTAPAYSTATNNLPCQ